MLKVRIEGTPEEIPAFVESLKNIAYVIDVSRFYPNRGESRGRVYVTITEPPQERR